MNPSDAARKKAEQAVLLACAGEVTTEEAITTFANALTSYAQERVEEAIEECAKVAEETYYRCHNHASENSDDYIAVEESEREHSKRVAMAIRNLKPAKEGSKDAS